MKQKRLQSLLLALVMLLGLLPLTAYADSTKNITINMYSQGWSNAAEVSSASDSSHTVSVSFSKEGGSNKPAYYNTGSAVRLYPKNTMTVSASSTISAISISFGSGDGGINSISVNTGTLSGGSWSGSATSVTFTIGGTSGHRRISSLTVTVAAPSHTHSFTYSASGATITATCSGAGDCDLTNKQATLTIAAEGGTYNGTTAYGATVTNNIPAVTGDTVGSVAYYKVDTEGATTGGTAQAGAPTGAGYYYASVTLTSGSNTYTAVKAFTVAKANSTAAAPTNLTATYGQTLADITLTNPQGNTEGAWAWQDEGTTPVGDAGAKTFKATFTPTDTANYKTVSNVDVSVTVNPAAPTATAPTNLTATYGQTLADITLTNPQGNTEGAWAWQDEGTTPVGDAGTKTFKANFTPTDTANYNTVSNVDVSVTVNPAKAMITTAPEAADDLVYNTLSKPLVKAGAATGGTVLYAVGDTQPEATAFSADIPEGTDAQSYTVWYYAKSNSDNYTDSDVAYLSVTLAAAEKDVLEGGNQTVKESEEPDNIRIDGDPNNLLFVKLDGRELTQGTDYAVMEGSTIISLTPDLIASLSLGTHTLFAQFTDGYAETSITVRSATSPVTGTSEKPLLWLGLMLVSALGLGGVLIANRKRFGVR